MPALVMPGLQSCCNRPASCASARSSAFAAGSQLRPQRVSASAALPRQRTQRLRVLADGSRFSARELKKGLSASGISVADCFEKSDLVNKFDSLSKTQQQAVESAISSGGAAPQQEQKQQSAPKQERAASGSSSTGSSKSSSAPETTPLDKATAWMKESFAPLMAGPQEGVQRLQTALADQQRAWRTGETSAQLRRKFDELDERTGISTKARIATQAVKTAAGKVDAQLGVTPFLRANGPPVLRALDEFRETPVGQLVSFGFTAWLFWSGAFWNILSFSLVALFLFNLIAPTLLEDWLRKQVQEAEGRMGGGGGAGGMGGMGGGGQPGGGGGDFFGAAGRGAQGGGSATRERGGPSGRGRAGSGAGAAPASGEVIDVEAQVKDT